MFSNYSLIEHHQHFSFASSRVHDNTQGRTIVKAFGEFGHETSNTISSSHEEFKT